MQPKILVVGAGYAGVSAAKRFARAGLRATVINPRSEFVERIRLHQLVAGTREATVALASLLPESTEFVQDSVQAIDSGEVHLTGGRTLEFDHLVHAAGSRGCLDVVPGAAEHAVAVSCLEDTAIAQQRFAGLPAAAVVTIVGGGLTGVELAAELAELERHPIRLVTDGPVAASISDRAREHLRHFLTSQGVEVIENTAVTEVQPAQIVLADGRTARSDLTILAAKSTAPALAAESGLDTDEDGSLRVDRTLTSTSTPAVVGAGDSARITEAPLRMSCQAAIPLGAHSAETVLHHLRGNAGKPVRPKFTGQCLSLGRRAGLMQLSTLSDRPVPLFVAGRPGATIKEGICASTVRFGLNPRIKPTYSWS